MAANSVTISPCEDKFVVCVTEDGETTSKTFETEAFAQSWASGQRFRVEESADPVELVPPELP